MNNQDCLAYIRGLLPTAKGVERKIGEWIADNPDDFINTTVKKMAQSIDVSEGSIIRFCQQLGFAGFTALKISIAQNIRSQNRFVLGDVSIGAAGNAFAVMTQVFDSIYRVMHDTLGIIDQTDLERASEVIRQAEHIEFYGLGTSAPIVQDAYYRFMRIGINATACVDPHIMSVSASLMRPGSLAIAISHTGRSIQTVMALKEAKEHGADTMCVSSYFGSPVTQYADIKLITSPNSGGVIKEATIARIAHIALLDSLCAYIAMQDSEKTAASQDHMLELLERQRY